MEAAELALFARGLRDATNAASGGELDAALTGLGWHDALSVDQQAAVSVLFECQGAAGVSSGALDQVIARGLGVVVSVGQRATKVVLPPLGRVEPPGRRHGGSWIVQGVTLGALSSSHPATVVVTVGAGAPGVLVAPADALQIRPVRGLDPDLGLFEVRAEIDARGHVVTGPAQWDDAIALGQLALGFEILGAGRAMLGLARQHAMDRVQFGRPIASFQAVRHRLAESLVALEAAASLLDASWQDPLTYAAMAKSFAGRQVRVVGRHCQQVLAGIGFTTEHPFHLFLRRAIVLDQLLGAGTMLTRRLGSEVMASRTLPPAFPL